MKKKGEILTRTSRYSFIRFNDKIKLHELIGCEHITKSEIGADRVEYIDKQVVIHTGSYRSCLEIDKSMFPEKYF